MHADGLQNAGGILAHPLFVHLVAAALLGLQHDVHQLFGLGLVQQVGTLLLQLVQQAVVGVFTANTSFSAKQRMLLSNEAPS